MVHHVLCGRVAATGQALSVVLHFSWQEHLPRVALCLSSSFSFHVGTLCMSLYMLQDHVGCARALCRLLVLLAAADAASVTGAAVRPLHRGCCRYGGSKLERARDMFESALKGESPAEYPIMTCLCSASKG